MKKVYRLKHIPTGFYWVKKSYGRLSENGTVFSTGCNSFSGLSQDDTIRLCITDGKFLRNHMDVFKRVGELKEHPREKWDMKTYKMIPTGESYFTWYMTSKVSDFEKEFVTLEPETPEPSVVQGNKEIIDKQELIHKIADICWNHRVNPDIETFDEWMNLIQDELKQQ